MCGKAFRQRSVYHKHLDVHANLSYMCAACNTIFASQRDVALHRKVTANQV